jgi:hypothetical protein
VGKLSGSRLNFMLEYAFSSGTCLVRELFFQTLSMLGRFYPMYDATNARSSASRPQARHSGALLCTH